MQLSIVTGGAVGIGNAICERLAIRGDSVVVIDVDQRSLDQAVGALRERSLEVMGLRLDLLSTSLEPDVEHLLELASFEHIGLVNCASSRLKTDLESETRETWAGQVMLGAWAAFSLSRMVVTYAKQQNISAAIVNITSPLARLAGDQSPGYHAAKAALEATTRYLAVHAPRLGARVTINAVEPGLIIQDRHESRFRGRSNAEWRRICESYLPSGSVGSQDDVAEVVAWLLSPAARFVNGATVVVDGGGTIQDQLLLPRIWGMRQSGESDNHEDSLT